MIIYAVVSVPKRTTGCLARQLLLTTGCVADDSVILFSSVAAVVVVFVTDNFSANVDVIESPEVVVAVAVFIAGGSFEDDVMLSGRGMTWLECTSVPFVNSLALLPKGTVSLSPLQTGVIFKDLVVMLSLISLDWPSTRFADGMSKPQILGLVATLMLVSCCAGCRNW